METESRRENNCYYQVKKLTSLTLLFFFLGIIGIILTPHTASAQEQKGTEGAKSHIVLKDINVTANRTETPVADVPASVTIIDEEEIAASPYQTVYDLLRLTAGIDVGKPYVAETFFNTVNLRGTGGNGNRTLVLVDGIPQNNANNGWVEWNQIPKEAIERIEIVRGSSSAQYGSNAMGGVINIITKRPGKKRETVVEGSCGNADTYSAKLSHLQKIKDWGVVVSGLYEDTEGFVLKDPVEDYDIDQFRTVKSLYTKLIYDFNEDTNASIGYSGLDKKVSYGREYFYGYSKNNRYWADLTHNGEKISWKAQAYVNDDKWEWNYDTSPNYDYINMYEEIPMFGTGGSLQTSIKLAPWNELILGTDFKYSEIDKKDKYFTSTRDSGTQGKQDAFSVFFGDSIRLAEGKFILDLGARYDWIKAYSGKSWDTNPAPNAPYSNDYSSKSWNEFTPKFGSTYHITESTTLKGTIGTGFNAPSLYELYSSLLRGPYLIQANPELKPEKILSYDFTIEHSFFENLQARLCLYQAHAKDFIGYDYPAPLIRRRQNISKVRMRGVEMELGWKINSQWNTFLNYTYNQSEIREYESDPEVEGNDLPDTPRNKLSAGVVYTNPEIVNFSVSLHHASKSYEANDNEDTIEDHSTVDLSIWKEIYRNITAKLEVENLFDDEYVTGISTSYDTIAPGMVVRGSLRIEF